MSEITEADRHVLEEVRDIVPYGEPMSSEDIVRELADRGAAIAVISPESVETYERDGETVTLVRGGAHRALSADALDERLGKHLSGFTRNTMGRWEKLDIVEAADRFARGDV